RARRAPAAQRQEVLLHGAGRTVRPDQARTHRQAAGDRTVISRREFLGGMAALASQSAIRNPSAIRSPQFAMSPPRVDASALRERIERLSTFGRPSGGTFADGVSRTAYSDADVEG